MARRAAGRVLRRVRRAARARGAGSRQHAAAVRLLLQRLLCGRAGGPDAAQAAPPEECRGRARGPVLPRAGVVHRLRHCCVFR